MIPTDIIIFGATGDLARQKLFPTLYGMLWHDMLPEHTTMWAIGRRPYGQEDFVSHLASGLERTPVYSPRTLQAFTDRLRYVQVDFNDPDHYLALTNHTGANRLFYLAVAPESFPVILANLKKAGLTEEKDGAWTRIIIEKPFGHDLASAQALAADISQTVEESQVYRLDHYLGKETIQNILAFRFSNRIFEPLWNSHHIDHIQITVAEKEGIGSRAAYYDETGAFRDLVQNHILQLLTILTMEEPPEFSFDGLSERALEVLRLLQADAAKSVFGQYEGYLQEAGVPEDSRTETFAMTAFGINSDRWAGVPIYVRTGKGLAAKQTEVSVQFKATDQKLFLPGSLAGDSQNVLTFRIQPDEGITLRLMAKTPRENMRVQPVNMEFCYHSIFKTDLPDAYERLLSDILYGDRTLTLREDVIEESWRITDRLLAQMRERPLAWYEQGSWGPVEADQALEADGRRWLTHDNEVCNEVRLDH